MHPREDDAAPRPPALSTRTLIQAGGFALAAAATLAVFLTDNAQLLKLAVVAVAWAFVIATFAAGRRGTDRVAAAAREAELRRSYEHELDREVAARREYELELENELRRETEDAMRHELDALRGDIAALSGLRDDIAALTSLRDEVARVAALRDDVAALTSLRHELGQLADLRADMGRLRAELTEQLSSEMLVERIVMRTQASRTLDGGSTWSDDLPPRELTGGWPAVRLDEPRETQQFEQVRVERSGPRPPVPAPISTPSWRAPDREPLAAELRPWDAPLPAPAWESPATRSWPLAPEPAAPTSAFTPPVHDQPLAPVAPTTAFPLSPPPRADEVAGIRPPLSPPIEPQASPLEWLAARSLLDPPAAPARPDEPARRRRTDDGAPEAVDPAAAPTTQRPAVPPAKPAIRIDDRGGYRVAVPEEPTAGSGPATHGNRLAEILAENGVSPATGGRRRRRYRDDDESDDVLARVLRGN